MEPDRQHDRRLLGFSRWLAAYLDSEEATRLSVDSLCRRLDQGDMDAADTRSTLDQLDELLMGEVARRHR